MRSSESAGGLSSLRFDSSMTTSDSRSSSPASKSGLAIASAMISRARLKPFGRHDEVVVGRVVDRAGVGVAADPRELLRDLLGAGKLLRALEEHVLEEVRHPGDLVRLVEVARLHPGVDRHHPRPRLLAHEQRQAVGQGRLRHRSEKAVERAGGGGRLSGKRRGCEGEGERSGARETAGFRDHGEVLSIRQGRKQRPFSTTLNQACGLWPLRGAFKDTGRPSRSAHEKLRSEANSARSCCAAKRARFPLSVRSSPCWRSRRNADRRGGKRHSGQDPESRQN